MILTGIYLDIGVRMWYNGRVVQNRSENVRYVDGERGG